MKKTRILHLEASPGWGGQEIRILQESVGMRKKGHKIFFAVQKKGKLIEKLKKAGFTVYEVNFSKKFWIFSFFQLFFIILKHKIQIINTHSSNDAWLGGVIGRILRKKIIRTRHLSNDVKGGLNAYLLYNVLADFIITTCYCIIPEISKKSKKKIEFFKSIPTGVDPEKMKIKKNKKKKKEFLVGTACFMRSWKGIEDFIKSADILRDHKDIKWMIIGGGHDKIYKELVKKLKLEKTVYFTGHLKNPFFKIASLDLFLLLSTASEGVSQASLQAAFLRKPIIGTPIGGIPEVCIEGKTGKIVPIFSPKKVAKAVLELKNNYKLRCEMQKNAKKLVEKNFTFQKMLVETENIYYKILKS